MLQPNTAPTKNNDAIVTQIIIVINTEIIIFIILQNQFLIFQ